MPLETTRDLCVQVAANQVCSVARASTLQISPLANRRVHRVSRAASRFPSQRYEVNALLLAHLQRLQQLRVVSILCHHASLFRRNFKKFFLKLSSQSPDDIAEQ